ncbi:hypothetical protein V5P93_002346 [Actinokineospora auranticolor]|uniref:hypothetical protein n=1 Tax=Actinokineospora auranticolor TaxID=155976 RepID=UPI001FE46460|nr:hypothetical protein [Actinokineospora auranticolor]
MDAVLVTDDPHRTYPTRTGPVPGDLITVTDPLTAHPWRFIPDNATPGQSWWLLDRCPGCATEVPVARVATLADLGDHLDPNRPGGANRKSAERPTECACSPSSPGEAAVRGVARNATVR